MSVQTYPSYSRLPASAAALFDDAREGDLFRSGNWHAQMERTGLRPGDGLRLYALETSPGQALVALLPAHYSRLYPSHPGARVLHFLQPDEQPYEPLTRGGDAGTPDAARQVIAAIRAEPRAYDVIRASPLDPGSRFAHDITRALRETGHFMQAYRQPDNRYETVAGLTFQDYLAARSRPLRETLERHNRLLLQGGRGRFFMARDREQLDDAWGAVHHAIATTPSDVPPESGDHLRAIMGVAADADALRLGMFFIDDKPANAQFWVVNRGVAHCLRLWSGPDQRTFPFDDLLTQMMALYLIDADHVTELDFGGISDEFADAWAPKSRERIGVVAFNRRTARGLRGAARHIGVGMLKALPARLWRRLRGQR